MSTWGEGYVTDLDYMVGYSGELNPSLLRFACLYAGIQAPSAASLHYLELGFGQGLSLNCHAAACPGSYWGTDFNPSHAAYAAQLAAASGSGLRVLDDSFSDLLQRSDLPDFDLIALHGVWSWVSDGNRRAIVEIVRRKLRVGGLLYVGYNCDPGWAALRPLRHLMALHARTLSAPAAGAAARVDEALAFCGRVEAAGALYFQNNPLAGPLLKSLAAQNRNYLAHEYFNADWQPMTFSEIVDWLEPARLEHVGSANLRDHVESLVLNEGGRRMLAETGDRVLRETLRDYFVHQRFRRDIFVKGARPLSKVERLERLDAQPIVLTCRPADVSSTVSGPFVKGTLQAEVYGPLVESLAAEGHAPKSIAELRARLQPRGLGAAQVTEAVALLIGLGHAVPAEPATAESRRRCAALNRVLCDGARLGADVPYLLSPVAGAALPVSRLQQCFVLALADGTRDPAAIARHVWGILSALGQAVVKEGKSIEGAADNVAALTRQAEEFLAARWPLLQALGVTLA